MPERILLQATEHQESDAVVGEGPTYFSFSSYSVCTRVHMNMSFSPSSSESDWRDFCCSNLFWLLGMGSFR